MSLRWVFIRDPKERSEPQALLSTEVDLPAVQIVSAFVRRWSMEITFQEARAHLGVEGQRQWSDLAIARSTPLRLALFSLVALFVHRQPGWQASVRQAAWYQKALPTFSDALDEAFLRFDGTTEQLLPVGRDLRAQVRQWTGIPVGVGIAATKVLAKLANRHAKKNGGVYALDHESTEG